MKFLVDAQLPPALARFLSSHGYSAEHVVDLEMQNAEDPDIWQYAIDTDSIFSIKRWLQGSVPGSVTIWEL